MKIKRVLVVEDESEKMTRMGQMLEQNQISEFYIVTNREDAIEKASSIKFDLLITDMFFPKRSGEKGQKMGFEMMLELAEKKILIPTIIYSFSLFSKRDEETLKQKHYPFIRQTMDSKVVEQILQGLLNEEKKSG